ncbi:MAG TPA: TonB-dependent receptor plug domain-containing protein [Burkholderiaceae bacterium]|nr:TonB-dependent receptor plug domain-containing protein [Burkholderiaceae bacterium]
MRKRVFGWRPTAVALAAGFCLISTAVQAQQTTGSINGRGAKGDTVQVENKSINVARQVSVGDDGTWNLSQLPPGTYQVTLTRASGAKETIQVLVSAGQGSNAVFGGTQTIVVTGALRTLDVQSVAPAFSLSKAEIDRIPVAQNVTAITLLAPGTLQGDGRIGGTAVRAGNLASISGASVAENAYYINGFNVTNITKGLAFNEVPSGAVAEFQVLNGGYGAEYGRSLGGVISVNTKRGTDEWKGGVSLSYEPKALRASSVYAEQSVKTGKYNLIDRPGDREKIEATGYVGGPILKDQLYVFGLVQGTNLRENAYGEFTQQSFKADPTQYLFKFDWNINKSNLLEFTTFSDRTTENVENYQAVTPYGTVRGASIGPDKYTTGGTNNILKWTGFITDDLTLSALYGIGKYSRNTEVSASICPAVYDGRPPRTTLEYKGCWSEANLTVDDPKANDERKAFRFDLEYKLGKHLVKAGLDTEKYTTVDGTQYSGGKYYRLFTLRDGGVISGTGYTNTTGGPIDYVRVRTLKNGGTFDTKNSAWYVQDEYQLNKDVVLNFGIRNEQFENLNDKGETFIKVKNTWAPRAGFAWDLGGRGETKIYGNAGRYYIPVYANTNVRLSGSETFYTDYFRFDGTFATDGTSVPGLGAQLGNRVTTSDGVAPDPRTVVDNNLKPLFQDEFILGFQQALGNRWNVGVKWTNRKLKNAMDDICEGRLSEQWALSAGYTADQAAEIGAAIDHCFLYNPGKDLSANVDLDGTGTLTKVVIPASALMMPKPKRKYDSLEFMAERQWDGKWSAQASLVIAWSRGNTEGYVKSDNGQDDSGITQDFDHPGLMVGSEGWLPNDRRYAFKANGAYALNDEWRISASFVASSGRPKNCFGNYPTPGGGFFPDGVPFTGTIDDDSPKYGASSFYCYNKLNPRGSLGRLGWTRDLSLQVQYTPSYVKGLSVKLDVFNVFNERGVRAIDEIGELDSVGSVSPTYGRPLLSSLQRARSGKITVNYEF